MFKQPAFTVALCVVLVLVAAQSAFASGPTGRTRVGGFIGLAMAEQDDVNEMINDYEDFWAHWDVEWEDSELNGGFFGGAFAEYLVDENWIIGAEFLRLSDSGGHDWYLDDFRVIDVDVDYDVSGNLGSVYGVYRFPLSESGVALRVGAGVGYLFGAQFKMDLNGYQEVEDWRGSGRDTTLVTHIDLEATGSAVAFHALVGAEYELPGNLLLSANIAYRVASIEILEVGDFSATVNGESYEEIYDIEEGKALRWDEGDGHFSTDEGDKVGLGFSGLHWTLSMAYAF